MSPVITGTISGSWSAVKRAHPLRLCLTLPMPSANSHLRL